MAKSTMATTMVRSSSGAQFGLGTPGSVVARLEFDLFEFDLLKGDPGGLAREGEGDGEPAEPELDCRRAIGDPGRNELDLLASGDPGRNVLRGEPKGEDGF